MAVFDASNNNKLSVIRVDAYVIIFREARREIKEQNNQRVNAVMASAEHVCKPLRFPYRFMSCSTNNREVPFRAATWRAPNVTAWLGSFALKGQ